jgi:hypothetical protein
VDHLIVEGYKHSHLPYAKLPALADYDRGAYLRASSFAILDPLVAKEKRHLFFGLMSYFRECFDDASSVRAVFVET